MIITSLLAFTVFRKVWGWSLLTAAAVLLPFFVVEIIFLSANPRSSSRAATCRCCSPAAWG